MAWVKLDDQFADHPKVIEAGPLAAWLYVCGLTYCSRLLTDGFIPGAQVRRLADVKAPETLAQRLVAVGLWEACDGGYRVHDYFEYQPTRDRVLATRTVRAEAGSLGGKQRASNELASAEANAKQAPSNLLAPSLEDASSEPQPRPVPSQPQPDPERLTGVPPAGAGAPPETPEPLPKPKRDTRRRMALPADWTLSDQDRQFAREHGLSGREIAHNEKKFRSYHTSQASLMADWAAAWRTWVLKEVERSPGGLQASVGDVSPEGDGRSVAPTELTPEQLEQRRQRDRELAQADHEAQQAREREALDRAASDPQRPPTISAERWAGLPPDTKRRFAINP